MLKTLGALTLTGTGYYLNQKYRIAPSFNFDFYNLFYQFVQKVYSTELAYSVTQQLMRMELFYQIDRDQYTKNLCGEISGIFLPNIIGLEEGNDLSGKQLESLFDIGFGFVEIGPLSQNSVFQEQEMQTQQVDENILIGKSILGSFKKRNFEQSYKYPVGVNIQVSQEIKEMTPFLAQKEYEQGCTELIDISDYLVINFTNSQNIKHLLEPIKLKELLDGVKQKRQYEIAVNALIQHENQIIQKEKKQFGVIYADDIYGFSRINSEAFVPKIYIKLDEKEHQLPKLIDIAQNYKKIGIEGLIIRTENISTISKIASLTQGEIPLIVATSVKDGEDVIKKIKKGAWAIQISEDYKNKGPRFVQDLMDDVKQELDKINVKNITQLRGVDIF
ncbi:dihydroorotate dehydrogenase (macronuclear) [Tetrahymena thermophila SB210]|uniref:Dihydroorotate dehydrogenase n=1 Tax=Tetrahymena thermophila (strain SB210) TaxID=312017 RepID=Q24CB5_TETTS|nr:dihydroorotate dehydrogenase [Tetrahymena thermophila SB210]EAS05323.1 dihydroorotate dehydrogenase [Tetrahymena thermophila SB210]|eukprot:XP_001025568.1 dihydroorotate dehydrogenase [Tetrahymena thermophila SB210]